MQISSVEWGSIHSTNYVPPWAFADKEPGRQAGTVHYLYLQILMQIFSFKYFILKCNEILVLLLLISIG